LSPPDEFEISVVGLYHFLVILIGLEKLATPEFTYLGQVYPLVNRIAHVTPTLDHRAYDLIRIGAIEDIIRQAVSRDERAFRGVRQRHSQVVSAQEIKIKGPLKKLRIASAFLKNIDSFVDYEKAPEGFNLKKLLKDAAIGGSYDSLRGFHYKSLFVGSMWFQDVFNLNVNRLERCVIHYTTLDGIIPFCAYNGLGYGDRIRERHSLSIKEWEKNGWHLSPENFYSQCL